MTRAADLARLREMGKLGPCPACPDGNEWAANGPTGRACPVCKGHAVVPLNGQALAEPAQGEKEE